MKAEIAAGSSAVFDQAAYVGTTTGLPLKETLAIRYGPLWSRSNEVLALEMRPWNQPMM